MVTIYTDGACKGNPGPGGWGAIVRYQDHVKEIYGAETLTTNNRMELMAAIEALRLLKRTCRVDLYTDSNYLRLGMQTWLSQWKQKNWYNSQKKPVKNADLWKMLDELAHFHDVHWHWVKGHSGHPGNERADALANEAIRVLLDSKA